jgi:hypothetical protein
MKRNSNSEDHEVLTLAWSTGGIVAVFEPEAETIRVEAGFGGPLLDSFQISAYRDLFRAFHARGYSIVGATFVSHQEQVQGYRRPEFRVIDYKGAWLLWETLHKWRQVVFAAGDRNEMPLVSSASRIASGLRYVQMRFDDLVSSYTCQLRARLYRRKAMDYEAFRDVNSFEVYKAIHALFWEIAVLRDALAEFASAFCFSEPNIRSMAGLCKMLLANPRSDALADELLSATDTRKGGWLAKFTNYRNCFTHVAPMEQAAGVASTVQDKLKLRTGTLVPQIYYPLPKDAAEIARRRSKGMYFGSVKELIEKSATRHNRSSEPDALEYLHGCIGLIGKLAAELLSRSPLSPQPIQIGPNDLIGSVKQVTPTETDS